MSMASYWLKASESDRVQGPYTGTELKSMAAGGQLSRTALVSADQLKWTTAAKVKGLFPAPAAAEPTPPAAGAAVKESVAAPSLRTAVAGAESPSGTAALPMAQLPYASSSIRTREVKWYLIASIVILGLAVLQLLLQVGSFAFIGLRHSPAPPTFGGGFIAFAVFGAGIRLICFTGWVGLWIYFTIWIYQVHEDMRQLTGGSYPISPGHACGFCYIPFFNLFWLVYAPFKLAEAIDQQLASAGRPPTAAVVLVFQILEQVLVLPCVCIFTPSPIFFALSMRHIQAGLNQLARFSPTPVTNASPNPAAIAASAANFAPVRQIATPVRQAATPAQQVAAPLRTVAAPANSPRRGIPVWGWVSLGVAVLVVALIAVMLISILIPAISRAREQANRVKCAANMHQIGLGLAAYSRQHGGAFPGRLEDAILTGDLTPNILICPDSQDTPSPGATPQQWATNLSAGGHCSYIYAGAGLTTARAQSSTVLLSEPTQSHAQQGTNLLFADGHAAWYAPADAQRLIQQSAAALAQRPRFLPLGSSGIPHSQPQPQPSDPPLSAASAGLLGDLDPATHARAGSWRIANGALCSSGRGIEVIGIPSVLPEECDITLDFVRLSGNDELGLEMRVNGVNFMLLIGAGHNTRMGVDLPGPKRLSIAPEAVRQALLVAPQVPHELVVKMRKAQFQAILDGKYTYTITGAYPTWKLNPMWHAAQNDTLALGTRNSAIEFHSLRVTAAAGQ